MKPKPLEKPQEMTVTIESLASTGKGVGTLEAGGYKRPVFVALTVPGDVARINITKKHKRYYEGDLVELITPSPERVIPSCPHFGICGACDYLHVSYKQQLTSKGELLQHYLDKTRVKFPAIQIIGAKQEKNYRIKTRVFSGENKIGFKMRDSQEIIAIKHCDIIVEPLNKLFEKPYLKEGAHSYGFDIKENTITKDELCYYSVDGCKLAYHPSGFVQSNAFMNKRMVAIVKEHVQDRHVLELYSGNGNFSVPLAKQGCKVLAVEGNLKSHQLALVNAQNNDVKVKAINKDVREFLRHNTKTYDAVLLDPPRTGAMDILSNLIGKAPRIVYVSCDAKSQSKEVKQLCENGYRVNAVYLLDMFPQTRHFETIVVLDK